MNERVKLTDVELERLNHLRDRAGLPLLSKAEAEALILAMKPKMQEQLLERIR